MAAASVIPPVYWVSARIPSFPTSRRALPRLGFRKSCRRSAICLIRQIDEQWSHVGDKGHQRWLWRAIDVATGVTLAFVFGRRQVEVCQQLMAKLKVFNIRKYYTDDWGSYSKFIPESKHVISKANMRKIENRNLQLRTRIKRLCSVDHLFLEVRKHPWCSDRAMVVLYIE